MDPQWFHCVSGSSSGFWVTNFFSSSNISLYSSRGLHKGRPNYRISLQPSKENIQHFETCNFFTFLSIFLFLRDIFALLDPDLHSQCGSSRPISLCGFGSTTLEKSVQIVCAARFLRCFYKVNSGIFWIFFCSVLYSTLLYLPPLGFHCVGGCWDRTQDSCNVYIDSRML